MFRYCDLDLVNRPESRQIVTEIERLAELSCLEGGWFSQSLRAFEYPFVVFFLRKHLPLGAGILDVGVFRSPFPHYMARMGYKVTAIDINKRLLPRWCLSKLQLHTNVKYRFANMERTKFPSGSFDCITSVSVLEHMQDPLCSLRESARLLKPGGFLLLTCDMVIPGHGMSCPHRALTKEDVAVMFSQVPDLKPFGTFEFDEGAALKFYEWVKTTAPHHQYIGGVGVFVRGD